MEMKIIEVHNDLSSACARCKELNIFDKNYKFSVRRNKKKFEILEATSPTIYKNLPIEERQRIRAEKTPKIIELRNSGKSWIEIEKIIEVGRQTCWSWITQYKGASS